MPTLPDIETDRLLLRQFKVEDASDYHKLETDPDVKKYLGGPSKLSAQEYEARIAGGAASLATTLAVTFKTTGQFLGRCGFTEYAESSKIVGWEINVVLGPQCPRKQGYATEIGLAIIPQGFETLRCDMILGITDAANIASLKLCDKLGMRLERDTIRYGQAARIYKITRHA